MSLHIKDAVKLKKLSIVFWLDWGYWIIIKAHCFRGRAISSRPRNLVFTGFFFTADSIRGFRLFCGNRFEAFHSNNFINILSTFYQHFINILSTLRRETPIQYPCCSRERHWVGLVQDLKGRYRNGQNEWMNEKDIKVGLLQVCLRWFLIWWWWLIDEMTIRVCCIHYGNTPN